MMSLSDWRQYELGQTGRIVTGKTPPTVDKDNFGGHIPFITPSDLDDRKFISKTQRCVTERGRQTVKGCFLPQHSVMVSCIGSDMGKVAVNVKPSVTNQQINSIIPNESFSTDFLYYCLKPRKEELQTLATSGSAQPILNKGHFSTITIKAPPLPEQKAIAAILGALDDKVELNRRMNATLEAMARALFKSWFVDFDPVRAKSEGRQPFGMDAETAALFPSRLVPSDLGDIPEGWSVKTIGELGRVITGKTPSTADAANFGTDVPFITIPDLDGRMFISKSIRALSNAGAQKVKSSLVPAGSVMMSCIATIGLCGITTQASVTNQQINSLVCDQRIVNPNYVYWLFKNITDDVFNSGGGGSVYTNVSKSRFEAIKVLAPDVLVQNCFNDDWFSKLAQNEEENSRLSKIRDYLLPKLISGDIRIRDAKKFVEAA